MTNKQKQHLLAYLGYYVGDINGKWDDLCKVACEAFQKDFGGIAVDGICGPETEKALKHAVAFGISQKEEAGDDFWKNIDHFTRAEFKCKCGGKHCNGYPAEMQKNVVEVAERARRHFGSPCFVSSALRCRQHNANVGGVSNSRHLGGKAIDCRIEGVTAAKLLDYVKQQPEIRYAYAIDENHVHFDIA